MMRKGVVLTAEDGAGQLLAASTPSARQARLLAAAVDPARQSRGLECVSWSRRGASAPSGMRSRRHPCPQPPPELPRIYRRHGYVETGARSSTPLARSNRGRVSLYIMSKQLNPESRILFQCMPDIPSGDNSVNLQSLRQRSFWATPILQLLPGNGSVFAQIGPREAVVQQRWSRQRAPMPAQAHGTTERSSAPGGCATARESDLASKVQREMPATSCRRGVGEGEESVW